MIRLLKMIWDYQEKVQGEIATIKAMRITEGTLVAIHGMAILEKQQCLLILEILENVCKMQILADGKEIPTKL